MLAFTSVARESIRSTVAELKGKVHAVIFNRSVIQVAMAQQQFVLNVLAMDRF